MNLILACNAGMSTSMMKRKLLEECEVRGIASTIQAVPVSELDDYVEDADAILLGPQVRYVEAEVKKKVTHIPVIVMDMTDYGSMNGKKVLDRVIAEIEQFK